LAGGETEKAAVKAGAAAAKPAEKEKKPAAAWDDGADEEEKGSPWEKKDKANGKSPPAKAKLPKSKAADEDEDDDEDEAPDPDAQFDDMLASTLLPDSTKKLIQGQLGLREHGIWVGQPDIKIMSVRGLAKVFAGVFAVTILTIILGVGGGAALEGALQLAAIG